MAVRLAQASKDENNRYTNGAAGDQTGSELNMRSWYSRPWDTVLRALDPALGAKIAQVAQILVKCNRIGYDQYQRTTLYEECGKIGWDINRINQINLCECDCSSLIAVILGFCGVSVPKTIYTGNMTSYILASGKFECLRAEKYLTGDKYLRKGDILVNTAHHTAVVLDDGEQGTAQPFVAYAATINVKTQLNVRTGPGTGFPIVQVGGHDFQLPGGLVVAIIQESAGWGRLSDISGWVSLQYLSR